MCLLLLRPLSQPRRQSLRLMPSLRYGHLCSGSPALPARKPSSCANIWFHDAPLLSQKDRDHATVSARPVFLKPNKGRFPSGNCGWFRVIWSHLCGGGGLQRRNGVGWWGLTERHSQLCLGQADRRQALRLRRTAARLRGLTATGMAASSALVPSMTRSVRRRGRVWSVVAVADLGACQEAKELAAGCAEGTLLGFGRAMGK